MPVPDPSSGLEHQHIHSVGDPTVKAQGKAKEHHATGRAAMFSPTALHGESTALGAWQHARSEQGRYNLHTAMQAPANQSHGKKSAAFQ